MTGVTELGYVRFGVSDLDAWRKFVNVIGLQMTDDPGKGRVYLRNDLWHHRIVLEQDASDDLLGYGLRVAGPAEFREMQDVLTQHQVPFRVADDDEARDRHVLELMTVTDPGGQTVEIFHGPRVDTHRPFYPSRGMYGKFCTSDGGLGHLLLQHGGLDATYEFYKVLGMRGSIEYRVPTPDGNSLDILFMHCNARDHTFAFGIPCRKRIHHMMLEVDNLDDVFMTYELVKEAGHRITTDLGRHANDQMFSFYCESPSGFDVEVGYGGRPATHQSEYYIGDTYGHGGLGARR